MTERACATLASEGTARGLVAFAALDCELRATGRCDAGGGGTSHACCVCGLKLLVYEALSYKLLVYEALSY